MKNLMKLLMILCVLIVAGMQSSQAQITIRVQWYPQCPDTCTAQEPCTYKVEYQLKNICTHPEEIICVDSTNVSCGAYYADFPCNYSCDDPSHNECYLLTGTVTKYCKGSLGSIAICVGSGYQLYTCTELMTYDPVPVTVSW